MHRSLKHITLVVKDYDEALDFYIHKLKFILLEDTPLTPEKRWVLIAPSAHSACSLLLAKANNEDQASRIGNQTGGRVFLFLHTHNFEEEYQNLLRHQITIVNGPRNETYGRVLVFEDLYGNKWDLIEQK